MSLFKGQSLLSITLDTLIDISTATVTRILYKKPDGTKGYWNATVIENTKVNYDLTTQDEIGQSGLWEFQAYVEIGGLKGYGDIVTYDFKLNLT